MLGGEFMSTATRRRRDRSINRVADDFYWTLQNRLLLPQLSEEGNAIWFGALESIKGRARRIETERLSDQGRITRELLLDAVDFQQRHLIAGHLEEDLNSIHSVMLTIWNWALVVPRGNVSQWREVIAHLRETHRFVEEYAALLACGLEGGRIQPIDVVLPCIETLGTLSSRSKRRNPLLGLRDELETNQAGKRQLPELRRELDEALFNVALPSHRALRQFLQRTYLPRAPRNPDRPDRYLHHLRSHLGSEYDLEDLMVGASRDVERLHDQLESTAREINPRMKSLSAFMRSLNRRSDAAYSTPVELLADAHRKVDEARELARAMVPIPADEVTIEPIPPTREAMVEASYVPTGPTTGRLQLNTGPLFGKNRRHEMATLVTHEVYGGHHLQAIYARKQSGLPEFRRNAEFLVYDEGWAMYAEHWRDERGWYAPYDRLGFLMQATRASAMAVVDVGVNTGMMTPRQAQQYLASAIFESRPEMKARVDRVLNWPGQGSTYFVGKSEMLRARDDARRTMGRHFDERLFHAKVLRLGSVPPKILRREIANWARRSLARKRGSRPR